MILLLTAIDKSGEVREFSCQLPRLESGFDLLTYMDAYGKTLVKARIVDESTPLYLPLKTVDADPGEPIVQELAKDWRQLLDEPEPLVSVVKQLDNNSPTAAPKPTMEHCLVYFSTSFGLFDEETIASILQQSRRNNAKAGITGLLLYMNGSIIQVLEGEKEAIEALYKRISRDERHTHVVCVLNRPIKERLFDRWSMAYETLTISQFSEVEEIVALSKWKDATIKADDSIILKTIKAFYETNRQ